MTTTNTTLVETIGTISNLKIDTSLMAYLDTCVKEGCYSNILLYGNPGTGKTTTANIIIESFMKKNALCGPELRKNILSMNASVYRNTNEFIQTIKMFSCASTPINNTKFVLLDEIDYMTIQGQKSLISLIKTFNNVVFICMCNYLSKLCDELKDYFIIFNYNCFGNILKTHIKKHNGADMNRLFDVLINDSDIRFYNNEKYRIQLLSTEDINVINTFIDTTIADICQLIIHNAPIHSVVNYMDETTLKTVQERIGIDSVKLKFIIYQEVFDNLSGDNKVDASYLTSIMEEILFSSMSC